MKFETLMLHSLFAACLLLCVLTLGSMLTSKAPISNVAAAHAHVTAIAKSNS
jgi:hypothetical protein